AKHVVASGLAEVCEIQLSYAIGVIEPVSIRVMTNESTASGITEEEITRRVRNTFDFSPGAMVADLGLLQPIYSPTSAGGHFGREPLGNTFPWERLDEARLTALQNG
ncbi:MAG TPA: methionine adenosyltransferase domain-containing protein, partial [Candidatus Thalassarchaeaceae archaeon]|nr:methionine adenosyltransferase domain-containing protein [Candidatus Thalassarchaeaceae archaeon]